MRVHLGRYFHTGDPSTSDRDENIAEVLGRRHLPCRCAGTFTSSAMQPAWLHLSNTWYPLETIDSAVSGIKICWVGA